MDYLGLAKQVVSIAVSIGVGSIVNNAVKSTTPSTISTLAKVGISIGGIALSGMLAKDAIKYTEELFDELVANFTVNNENV